MVWFAWSGSLGPGAVVCFPLDTPIHVFFVFFCFAKVNAKDSSGVRIFGLEWMRHACCLLTFGQLTTTTLRVL